MAALRELQEFECSDDEADVTPYPQQPVYTSGLAATPPTDEDDFFEEFPEAGLSRQHESTPGNTDWEAQAEQLSRYIVQPGSYGQRRLRSVWGNRFDAFRREELRQDPSKPFYGKELEKFLMYYFIKYKPRKSVDDDADDDNTDDGDYEHVLRGTTTSSTGGKPEDAWSYVTANGAIAAIQERSKFRWEDFAIDYQKLARARGSIDALLSAGYVSKVEKISRNQALGVYFIRRMVQGLLSHSLTYESQSWDITIQYLLAVVLQAALNVRVGDILASDNERAWSEPMKPALYYSDVVLVADGETVAEVKGQWTIRNAKGSQGDPKKAFSLDRHALESSSDNALCPVKLLLANALRHHNVHGTTVEEVIETAGKTPNRRIAWLDPDLPILCSVFDNVVRRDAPMRVRVMGRVLDLIATIVKPNTRMRSHDIRYGAAEDLLAISRTDNMTIDDIAQELNHSARRTTRRYTRKSTLQDTWAARVRLPDAMNIFSNVILGAEQVAIPTGKKRKLELDPKPLPEDGNMFVNTLASIGNGISSTATALYRHNSSKGLSMEAPTTGLADTEDERIPMDRVRRINLLSNAKALTDSDDFVCTVAGCPFARKGFTNSETLQQHQLMLHSNFLPGRCPVPGCTEEGSLGDFDQLEKHMQEKHLASVWPIAHKILYISCRYKECDQKFPRNQPDLYRKHLRNRHQLEVDLSLTPEEAGDGTHPCLYPGCPSTEKFPVVTGNHRGNTPYAQHLTTTHNLITRIHRMLFLPSTFKSYSSWVTIYLPVLVANWKGLFMEPPLAEDDPSPGETELAPLIKSPLSCTLPNCPTSQKVFNDKWATLGHIVRFHPECYSASCPFTGCSCPEKFINFHELDKHVRAEHLAHGLALMEAESSHPCRERKCKKTYKKTNKSGYTNHLIKAHRIAAPIALHEFEKPTQGHPCYVEACSSTGRFTNAREYEGHLGQAHQLFTIESRRPYLKGTFIRWIDIMGKIIYQQAFGGAFDDTAE